VRHLIWLTALALLAAGVCYAEVTPIADIKTIDANGNALQTGKQFTVTGVVTVGSGTFSTTDLDVYIQDETGGINVSKTGAGYYALKLGDSVVVTGIVDQGGAVGTRGNTKLLVSSLADIAVVGKAVVPTPLTLPASELARNAAPPLEAYEGLLVRVEYVTMNPADWPASGIDKNITAQDPTGSLRLRVDKDTDIDGSEPPRQPFVVVGVVVQDDATSPTLSGYAVWPRSRRTDFLAMGNGCGIASLEPSTVEITASDFDLGVTLAGNLTDTITAFSIELPLSDGWTWPGGQVTLSGEGLSDAQYQVTATGVSVTSAAINDGLVNYGTVTFKGVRPPLSVASSAVALVTSVDGSTLVEIESDPVLRCVRPKPDVIINEVYPGLTAGEAFIELYNGGTSTAYLDGFALCEARAVAYCDLEIRHIFGPADSIPAGGYLVIARSAADFLARFGRSPDAVGSISPLGDGVGDGALVGGVAAYEMISLWRDATLDDLVDHLKYRDAVVSPQDLCDGVGSTDDGLPFLPPAYYSIVSKSYPECCPYEALSAAPTPGEENVRQYRNPVIKSVTAHSQNTVEIIFSEPMTASLLAESSRYLLDDGPALRVYPSVSGRKVLALFSDASLGDSVTVEANGLTSWAGMALDDTLRRIKVPVVAVKDACAVQAWDAKGYSLFNGQTVSVLGFITVPPKVFQPSYQSIYVQGLDGCGINVFSYDLSSPIPRLGDFVRVTGGVEEYVSSRAGSTTEIFMSSPASLVSVSTGYPEPPVLALRTGEVGREENEGRLVQTEGAVVSASDFGFYLNDGSGGIQVYQNYTPIDFTKFRVGMYIRIKGVILQYDYTLPFLDGYELVPRYDSDIEVVDDAFAAAANLEVEKRVFCPTCGDEGFSIRFNAPSRSDVVLRILDVAGRLVTTLYSGSSVGDREIVWAGRDQRGEPLPPGLYVCHLEAVESVTGTMTTESAPIVIGVELR
jgi:hypothetical protein